MMALNWSAFRAESQRRDSDWCSERHWRSHCLWKEGSSCSTNHSSLAIASKKLIAFLYCSRRLYLVVSRKHTSALLVELLGFFHRDVVLLTKYKFAVGQLGVHVGKLDRRNDLAGSAQVLALFCLLDRLNLLLPCRLSMLSVFSWENRLWLHIRGWTRKTARTTSRSRSHVSI